MIFCRHQSTFDAFPYRESMLVPIINFILNIKLLDRKMKHNVKIDSLFLQPEKLNVYKNDSDTSWDYTLTGM